MSMKQRHLLEQVPREVSELNEIDNRIRQLEHRPRGHDGADLDKVLNSFLHLLGAAC